MRALPSRLFWREFRPLILSEVAVGVGALTEAGGGGGRTKPLECYVDSSGRERGISFLLPSQTFTLQARDNRLTTQGRIGGFVMDL